MRCRRVATAAHFLIVSIIIALGTSFTRVSIVKYQRLLKIMATFVSSEQQDLLSKIALVKALTPSQQKAIGAIVGAAVGDAATRPFHWVYDRKLLEATIEGRTDIEFWPESISPFYTLPTGRRSCYNDLMLLGLRALPTLSDDEISQFSATNVVKEAKIMFSPESEYGAALIRRKEAYDPAKRLEKREPVPGPWQQGAVTAFLEDLVKDEGSLPKGNPELKESDGFCSALPLIIRLCSVTPDMTPASRDGLVRQAASLFSSNEVSLAHCLAATHLLHRLINQPTSTLQVSDVYEVLTNLQQQQIYDDAVYAKLDLAVLQDELGAIAAAINENHADAVERFGKACAHPGSFMGAVLAVLQHGSDFSSVIRQVIRAGGCNCSRVNLAGALVGAMHGIDYDGDGKGIPLAWIEKTDAIDEIITLAIKATGHQ